MSLIEINAVTKRYGEQIVLSGITMNIERGKIYLIKGRSGSGKSTLLNICSFLENPDNGDVAFKGVSLRKLSENDKKALLRDSFGYIFQEYNLFEDYSAYDNLLLYLLSICDKSASEMDTIINENLNRVGLSHKSNDKAKLLSGGERQRLTLARTLILPKEVIFADEPSANIDNANVIIMKEIFIELRAKGTALMIVTHDSVFDDIADYSYLLEEGVFL